MDQSYPYPLQETPLSLPSGRVVVVLNHVVYTPQGRPGGHFAILYRSVTPASDAAGRRAEATEVIAQYETWAEERRYRALSAQICNTQAAAEMREAPELIFTFERGTDATWTLRDERNESG